MRHDILSLGKLPPQAVDIEDAVLGALILENRFHDEIIPILIPDIFYRDDNQRIFSAIKTLYELRKPIDMLTVINQLKSDGSIELAGGAYIKNIPYAQAKFYFGKYKDYLVSEVNDIEYLSWFLQNVNYPTTKDGWASGINTPTNVGNSPRFLGLRSTDE